MGTSGVIPNVINDIIDVISDVINDILYEVIIYSFSKMEISKKFLLYQ